MASPSPLPTLFIGSSSESLPIAQAAQQALKARGTATGAANRRQEHRARAKGKLIGSPNPYLRVDNTDVGPSDPASVHLIDAFESWCDHHWQVARAVWPE